MVTCPEDRVRVAAVWLRIAKLLERPKTRWRHVRGPAAAVIATLFDAGWKTPSASVWIQPDGTTWTFSADFLADKFPDFSGIKTALAADLRRQLWEGAAKFRNGKGLEAGADLRPIVSHLRSLSKNGRYEMHGAVLCCATASAWTNGRVAEEYPEADSTCPRCCRAPETELHRHWECQANDEIKACNKSKHLISRARLRAAACPAFWLRGIVPSEWTAVPPPCQAADPCEENIDGNLDRIGTPTRRLWCCGDGSGGVNTRDPRLRRCGWAWVELQECDGSPTTLLHRIKCAPLHGMRQTVNRAELYALLDCLRSTQGSVTFVSDSAYVVNGFAKLSARASKFNPKSHRDLWSALATAAALRDVEVVKVESHLSEAHPLVVDGTFPIAWVKGNDAADVLAGEAAADAEVPSRNVEAVKWVDATATLVRTRLAATLMSAAEANPHRTAPPRPTKKRVPVAEARLTALAQALADTAHTPDTDSDGAYSCRMCGTSALQGHAVPWLRTVCVKPSVLPFCPQAAAPVAGAEVRLGNAIIHKSHAPVYYAEQRTWACTSCGRAAVNFMRELAEVCKIKASAKGKLNLSRLQRGFMIGDSATAKAFNHARGINDKQTRQLPPSSLPAASPDTEKRPARGIKRRCDVPASSAATALRAKIRAKEDLAASAACAAAAAPHTPAPTSDVAGDAASSSCPAAERYPGNRVRSLRDAFAAPTYNVPVPALCTSPLQFGSFSASSHAASPADRLTNAAAAEPAAATGATSLSPQPVSSAAIEQKRIAAVAKRAIRQERQVVAAAAATYVTKATASYEAAVAREAAAAAAPLPAVDSEEEWENELRVFHEESMMPAATPPPAASQPPDPELDPNFEQLPSEPVPQEWMDAFANTLPQPAAVSDIAPPAESIELHLELPVDLLTEMLSMHEDGLPVTWPYGTNAQTAAVALRHRLARL